MPKGPLIDGFNCGPQLHQSHSEENEDLLDVTFDALDLFTENIEADSLGKRAALADGHDITDLDTEGWGAVARDGLMALLESVILLDVMKVIASDDNGS